MSLKNHQNLGPRRRPISRWKATLILYKTGASPQLGSLVNIGFQCIEFHGCWTIKFFGAIFSPSYLWPSFLSSRDPDHWLEGRNQPTNHTQPRIIPTIPNQQHTQSNGHPRANPMPMPTRITPPVDAEWPTSLKELHTLIPDFRCFHLPARQPSPPRGEKLRVRREGDGARPA